MLKSVLPLAFGLVFGAGTAFASCAPIPGAEQIWSNEQLHWVFIGEMHGSNETPAAFADLVCDGLLHHKNILVALERPTSEQQALADVLSTKEVTVAQKNLLDQPGWKNGMDGRASKAMLELILALHQLHSAHPQLSVYAFDTPDKVDDSPGKRDHDMGEALLRFGKAHPGNLILILTGNIHAMQAPVFGYDLAAMFIPTAERLSLEVTDAGGSPWANSNGMCGPSKGGVEEKGRTDPRGIYLDPHLAPFGKVDGILSLGVPLTASEPADGDPNPLPECRAKYLAAHAARSQK